MSKNNLEEIKERIYYQTTEKYMSEVGEVVYNEILERIPPYYEGGAVGLLNRVMRRYGGRFVVPFRLGYAGFSGSFYLSYNYYDSAYDVVKLEDKQLTEDYLVTQSDIDFMILGFVRMVEEYLER